MLNIGLTELLVFCSIALLVLGPNKLPEAARFAAQAYRTIKRFISNVQNDIDRELRLSELREQMQQEMQKIQSLEAKMHAQIQALQHQKVTLTLPKNSPKSFKQMTYVPCAKPILHGPILHQKYHPPLYKVAL